MGESADGLYEAGRNDEASDPEPASKRAEGPDPVIGAGIALFGIFLMGLAGARGFHYVFDAGIATAVLGAVIFVLFVALSAMKQRSARVKSAPPPSPSS
jgi:hypothetical protein